MDIMDLDWQYRGDDLWMFGLKIRGFVRKTYGQIYFDEDQNPSWIWIARSPGIASNISRGASNSLEFAVEAVEHALLNYSQTGA